MCFHDLLPLLESVGCMKEGMVFTPVSQGPAPADVWGKLTPVPADMGGVPLIQQSVAGAQT